MSTNMADHMAEKAAYRRRWVGAMAIVFIILTPVAAILAPRFFYTPAAPSYSSAITVSSGSVTSYPSATTTQICTATGNGFVCGVSGDYEFREIVREQIPLEAQDASGPRSAFRKWVMNLEDGKAKSAYISILDSYDEQDKNAEIAKAAKEKRRKELLADVPRAKCRRLVDKTPDGGIKAGDYKCEAARTSDLSIH